MPNEGRIYARPTTVTHTAPVGLRALQLDSRRDSYLYVPSRYRPRRPCPLVLLLHGAHQSAQQGLALLQRMANSDGLILLAPASTGHTWDLINGRTYGPDVMRVNNSLQRVFREYAIDPSHLAIGGFSDGASYALSLGVTNGDLFTHVIAFSPGFMTPAEQRGHPHIFISHGTQDPVLSIAICSRRLIPPLQQAGYEVNYREFDGGHTAPPAIARAAVDWFIAPRPA